MQGNSQLCEVWACMYVHYYINDCFILCPCSYGDFQAYFRAKKNKTFISKPEAGSQGKGIFVFKSIKVGLAASIACVVCTTTDTICRSQDVKPGEHMVCQQYISKVSNCTTVPLPPSGKKKLFLDSVLDLNRAHRYELSCSGLVSTDLAAMSTLSVSMQ